MPAYSLTIKGMEHEHEPASIGIDVAKQKFDVAFLGRDHSVRAQTFENNRPGIRQFLRAVKRQGTAATVPCVLESTGQLHLSLALSLASAGYRVNCINPLITKKHQRGSIRNIKTDAVDAERLAQIGLLEPDLPVFTGDRKAIEVKRLVSYLGKMERIRQQLRDSMTEMRASAKITAISVSLRSTQTALKRLDQQIAALKERICELAPAEAGTLAEATKGLSHELVAVVLAVLSDKQFTDRDQLAAFVGMDVMPRQSGKWKGRGRLSKRGNAYVRKVLFQIAWGLKQHNPIYRARYDELRAGGKNYTTTLIILARKFLRFLYAYYWQEGGCPQMSL